jgi:hypothetical protein
VVTAVVNALQLLLVAIGAWTFARRARAVLFAGRLDRRAFVPVLREAIAANRLAYAASLCRASLPAWPAAIALRGVDALTAGANLHAALDEQRLELLHRAPAGISTLRALARMAMPLAFIGVLGELGHAIGADHGLAALQRGLPERLAIERALLTFALGIGSTLLAVSAAHALMRGVQELSRAAADVAAVFERRAPGADHARM